MRVGRVSQSHSSHHSYVSTFNTFYSDSSFFKENLTQKITGKALRLISIMEITIIIIIIIIIIISQKLEYISYTDVPLVFLSASGEAF